MAYLEDLVATVRNQIRDDGTTQAFTDAELQMFVMDAVYQYSRYRPKKVRYTLQMIAGQSQYQLPTDWMTVNKDSFQNAVNPLPQKALYGIYAYEFDTLMTAPASLGIAGLNYSWYDAAQQLVVTPAPMRAFSLIFDYEALHNVTLSSATTPVNCTIPQQLQAIAMYWASSQALKALLIDKSKLAKYRVGSSVSSGLEVDNTQTLAQLNNTMQTFLQGWENEIMLRPGGKRAGDIRGLQYDILMGGIFGGAW